MFWDIVFGSVIGGIIMLSIMLICNKTVYGKWSTFPWSKENNP